MLIAPAMQRSRIARIERSVGEPLDAASRGASVVVGLADDVDASRGTYLVAAPELPDGVALRRRLTVEVCWMTALPAQRGQRLWVKHQSRRVSAQIAAVTHRLDVVTGTSEPAETLRQNDLGTLELVLGDAILASTYLADRALGSVLLVDPTEGDTVGAGMIVEA